mgnify:CR=1 FL=1
MLLILVTLSVRSISGMGALGILYRKFSTVTGEPVGPKFDEPDLAGQVWRNQVEFRVSLNKP